jgi:hypothetical protein
MVHLWSTMLRHRGVDRRMAPPKGSILREWVDRHPVGGWVGEYDDDQLEQSLLPDTVRVRFSADLATGIEDIERTNAKLRANLSNAAGREAQLQADLGDAASREAQLRAVERMLRDSTSWKLTEPLRRTVNWFRKNLPSVGR